jgi:predicted negative regulator of RcsB-dependent stress response
MADTPENTPAENLGAPVVESDVPTSAEAYFEKNKRKLLLVICLVLIGSAAYIILSSVSKEKSREASNAFTLADTSEEYRQVSIDYQGTIAGGNALLMKADRETQDKNPKEALATLTEFVDSYQDHPRYTQGLFAIASHAQINGNNEDARSRFQEIVDTQSRSEFAPLALMRLGDLAMVDEKYDDARGIYNSVMPRFPANPFLQKVTQKIALLDLKSPPPDLKKPEAPETASDSKPAADAKSPVDTKPAPVDSPASTTPEPAGEAKADAQPKAKATPPAEETSQPKPKAKKNQETQDKSAKKKPASDKPAADDASAPDPAATPDSSD